MKALELLCLQCELLDCRIDDIDHSVLYTMDHGTCHGICPDRYRHTDGQGETNGLDPMCSHMIMIGLSRLNGKQVEMVEREPSRAVQDPGGLAVHGLSSKARRFAVCGPRRKRWGSLVEKGVQALAWAPTNHRPREEQPRTGPGGLRPQILDWPSNTAMPSTVPPHKIYPFISIWVFQAPIM